MLYLILPLVLYCLSGVLDAFMDTIKDHWSTFIFKDKVNAQFWNPAVSWVNKYIDGDIGKGHKTFSVLGFTFNVPDALTDAWHIAKILREGCNILAIVFALLIPFTYSTLEVFIALIILFGVLRNLCFNLFYNKFLVKVLTILIICVSFSSGLFAQHTIEVKHKYYTLEYDTVLKSPLVSWYIQTTSHALSTYKIDRKSVAAFHQDPLIADRYQVANNKEYLNNGKYDKGHLSPYSAFYFDLTAAKESMYYTNTAPQYSFFNEHPWERLEQYVLKTLAPTQDSIYVYTGCLYGDSLMNDVPVPDYYWKVIYYNGHTEAWYAKNKVTESTSYEDYAISTRALKKIILSYYPNLQLPF